MKSVIRILILSIIGYLRYQWYQFNELSENLGECGLSNGPCYGQRIDVDLKSASIDQYMDSPNGKIGFLNTQDSLAPIIFKIDKEENILWSVKLETDSCSGIPLKKMSGMKVNEDGRLRIEFFNETYMEPGIIYLTENYDFEYLCLSPM